ncbi:MAG: hypothetical protein IT203_05105 [Fimbriimonadaceae bacterium]|nr:hypothetical protein [Fimbriimonadaceae bacterium]
MIMARAFPRKVQALKLSIKLTFLLLGASVLGTAQTLNVDVAQTRSIGDVFIRADHAVRQMNRNLGILTHSQRANLERAGRYSTAVPSSFPATVWLTANGGRLPAAGGATRSGSGLTLVFDASGANAFDPAYKTLLQSIYSQAQPFMDAVFGLPSASGNVAVKNYDATMSDRNIVSGGYYVPNAPGTPEIRFPFYGNDRPEVTAVNFIHCLLLAYIGQNQYGYDAFKEGLVRAAVIRIARTSAAMLNSLDSELVEQVLTNTYDVEGHYDWYNQRALGGSTFIAPNLRDVPLPDAGSLGGLYLLRYKMAGSAWTKVLVEYPGFIASFNSSFYGQPGNASNVPALVTLGQTTLNALRPGDPTVEGLSFPEWFKRQFILETTDTRGTKLLLEPIPITSGLSGTDFGVFILQANWFETLAGGNETLLSGTAYPILWEGNLTFNRIFANAEDERMDIAGGYGAVVPNLRNINSGQPYRATIDLPVQDQMERVYLPAGAIATASQQNPRDFYGTVTGANIQAGDTLRLQVTVDGAPITDVPVQNNAFGVSIGTQDYLNNSTILINVVRNRTGADTTLYTRRVNKGPGPLGVDLRVDSELTYNFTGGLPKGIAAPGFPVDPFLSLNSAVLGTADNATLAARFNSSKAKYELYPDLESFKVGHGYFVRLNAANPGFSVTGRVYRNVEAAVALKPGWNLIACPLLETVPISRVRVVRAADFPTLWADAAGVDIGTDFFEFTPGPNDAASGAPETGTLSPASQFEPGKAYFVRVLAPEGVSLSFAPAGFVGMSPQAAAPSPTGWKLELSMAYSTNKIPKAIIGQSNTATRSFDPREDSGMPPGFGAGFQIIIEDYDALYRDIRPQGFETYTVHLQGLTVGKVLKLNFKALQGTIPKLILKDSTGKSLGQIRPGFIVSIVPKSRNEYYRIERGQ